MMSPEDRLIAQALQLGVSDARIIDAACIRVEDHLADICREPGAAKRVAEFLAATRGEFMHPTRLKLFEK